MVCSKKNIDDGIECGGQIRETQELGSIKKNIRTALLKKL